MARRTADQRFDQTQLRAGSHGKNIHRDYAAHFFRWAYARQLITAEHTVLDIGCGQDLPLVRVLSYPTGMQPAFYVGVDLNPVSKVPSRGWAHVMDRFDFINKPDDPELVGFGPYDVAVCFEVIEHMGPADGKRLLENVLRRGSEDITFLLSTPVFNGKAAKNHIHEYRIPELQELIESAGWRVENRFGTYASWNEIKPHLSDEHRRVHEQVARYYHRSVASTFLAPLYPDHSRNNIWVLRPAKYVGPPATRQPELADPESE
jgi:hypothetical protein